MGKITVKHYLNKQIKPKIENKREAYPLYVQVIANQTNYRFKSDFSLANGYMTELDLTNEIVVRYMESERKNIEHIVSYLMENGMENLLTAKHIKRCTESVFQLANSKFGTLFEKESKVLSFPMPDLLFDKTYFEIVAVLNFTGSHIESDFSEDYRDCRIAMDSLERGIFEQSFSDLRITNMKVFDYIYMGGSNKVLEAIKRHHGIISTSPEDSEKEYQKILEQLTKLITE